MNLSPDGDQPAPRTVGDTVAIRNAWERGRIETVCGLSLSRSRLDRLPHVTWADVQPESGRQGARRDDRRLDADRPRP